jgi:hypothetical protein
MFMHKKILVGALITALAVIATGQLLHGGNKLEDHQLAGLQSGADQEHGAILMAQAESGTPIISIPDDKFDFGIIAQGSKVSHKFIIKNIGDAPLKLIKAKGS